jgi:hypothetical protein
MKMTSTTNFRVDYDRPVDVLLVSHGDVSDYEGDGLPNGVELDYTMDDNTACGAKVIGFERNGWRDDIDHLAELIAGHLSVDRRKLRNQIEEAVGQ